MSEPDNAAKTRGRQKGLAGPGLLAIESNRVYTNASGEARLVVSVGYRKQNPVVEWRTPDPALPIGAKAHGSATVASFRRWAVSARKATKADWAAFEEVQRMRRLKREEKQWIRDWKQRKAKAP